MTSPSIADTDTNTRKSRAQDGSSLRPLCSSCQAAVAWTRSPDRQPGDNSDVTLPFQPSFEALQATASRCSLCEFVLADVFDGKPRHTDVPASYKLNITSQNGFRKGLFKFDWEEVLPYPSPHLGIPANYWVVDSKSDGIKRRAAWKHSDPTFDLRLQIVPEWISDCEAHHQQCIDTSSSAWPKRLLDLKCVESLQTVKLVESSILVEQSLRYATLSHCWGPPTSKPPLRTTKFNQIGHSKGIALATLTLNFLDAVLICRKLGLDYIWIDSLCIIQDDSADWEAEAAKMADIYRGSYLNIAAAAAADAHGGIIGLTSLPDPKDRLTNINYSSAASDTETLILQEGLGVGEYWQINKTSHPYFGRGWVLQELALSPRTVLFTAGQMFWQCRSCFVSEDGTLWSNMFLSLTDGYQSPGTAFDFTSTPWAARDMWNMWFEAYARRQLSYLSDTAPAIAGLVDFFSKAAHNTPMLGLWKETLRYDLLWAMRWPNLERPPPQTRLQSDFPSWSWLSVLSQYGRDFEMIRAPTHEQRGSALRVETWEEDWAGARYASRLVRSRLVLNTFIRDATLSITESGEWRSTLQCVSAAGTPAWPPGKSYCSVDYLFPAGSQIAVKIVHVGLNTMDPPNYEEIQPLTDHFLVVMPAAGDPGYFYRVGKGQTTKWGLWDGDWESSFHHLYDESHRRSIELV